MRADRLVAALLLLQQRGRATASELAAELEVSVATARRDLEALSAAGVPVYPQPGRGGGWSLVGGARTDLSGLTSGEAQALFLLVGPAATVSDEAKAALRKLVRALPATFRDDAVAAAAATTIDPARWGDPVRPEPTAVGELRTAVVQRRRVRLTYQGRAAAQSHRLVEPWGLADKDGVWYLLAGTDRGRRTFRVDRIVAAEITDERFGRPEGFDLDAAWADLVEELEGRRSRVSAMVLVDPRHVPILADQFGRHCHEVGRQPDGRVLVRLGGSIPLDIARILAGWGNLVDVVEPQSVRNLLARLGTELVAAYT
ncbi:WYL domain-containing protein [Intrasporangium sp.]|uniref:helix-turn-helix transcriptional regulator n=1 Tax=Intrasporangium sp. TaxID=1925024 RepID=UPI003365591A